LEAHRALGYDPYMFVTPMLISSSRAAGRVLLLFALPQILSVVASAAPVPLDSGRVAVGACAATTEALVSESPEILLFRDTDNSLRISLSGAESTAANVTRQGEARFRVSSPDVRLDVSGRRLARVDGRPYLIFDARAKFAQRLSTMGATRSLACHLAADRLIQTNAKVASDERASRSRSAAQESSYTR
jgi:hypothetical protein